MILTRLVLEAMEPERESRESIREERANRSDIITPTGRGTSALYTLKRLKRDRRGQLAPNEPVDCEVWSALGELGGLPVCAAFG